MKKMTEQFLQEAFAGESQAHMKYNIFSEVAEKEGMPNVARMFKAIAYAEQVHATNHFRELGMIRSTTENLGEAMGGEDFEVDEMYPAYKEVAKMQGEKGAVKTTNYALEAEKIHSKMYHKAQESAEAGNDIELKTVYICPVCGYTHEGDPPDYCPVCGAAKEKVNSF